MELHGSDPRLGVRRRNWYGGKGPWRGHEGIAYRVNWIGLNPSKTDVGLTGPHVTFEHFVLYDDNGPELQTVAPELFKHMFGGKKLATRKVAESPWWHPGRDHKDFLR